MYLLHLQNLRIQADIGGRGREEQKKKQQKAKSVPDYDWHQLVDSGEPEKLRVPELNKYLVHHGLSTQGKKLEKLKRISWHVLGSEARSLSDDDEDMYVGVGEQTEESGSESDSSTEYDSEDDIVLAQLIQGQNTDSELDVETGPSDIQDIWTYVLWWIKKN